MTGVTRVPPDKAASIRALPLWQGEISIAPLLGGISNESWLVRDAQGGHVVRYGKDYPFHHVFREREIMTARAAEVAGFAPAVEFAGPGVMVSRHLNAQTYTAADVRGNIEGVARLIRNFHREMGRHVSGPGFIFWPFHVIRDYARTLREGDSRKLAELPRYLALADELEAAQIPLPIIFSHNDLLPANFLDDGDRLWLIDFEYAGFSTPMFDLAGVSSNAGFSATETNALLRAYFGEAPSRELLGAMTAMQCASLLREAMWSMASELYLNAPGTDYPAYTEENLARFEIALDHYRSVYGKKT